MVTITGTVTDADGASASWSVTATQGSGDPYAAVDGSSNAPIGVVQYPALLNSYALNGAPAKRVYGPGPPTYIYSSQNYPQPPWFVAGVDYYVGVPSNVTLQDPGTNCATVIAALGGSSAATYSANKMTLRKSNLTLNGWNFSLEGGTQIGIANGVTGTVIKNCKFASGTTNWNTNTYLFDIQPGSGSVSITNCMINSFLTGAMVSLENSGSGASFLMQYCYVNKVGTDAFQLTNGSGNVTIQYNLFENVGYNGHPDVIQTEGSNWGNVVFNFNTLYQQDATLAGTLGVGNDLGTFSTSWQVSFNTVICNPGNMQELIGIISPTTTVGPYQCENNYFDPTNYTDYPHVSSEVLGSNGTFLNAVNMLTGVQMVF